MQTSVIDTHFYSLILHFLTHENVTYLEYDDWGRNSKKNKYIFLLTSPLFHEIINLIYLLLYIYIYIYIYIY